MARLGKILEPGERLIARDPEAGVQWMMRIMGAILLVAVAWQLANGFAKDDWLWIVLTLAASLIVMSFAWTPSGGEKFSWQAAITDRRLLYRSDWGGGYESVPLAEVEIAEPHEPFEPTTPEEIKLAKLVARMPEQNSVAVKHGERIFAFPVDERGATRFHEAMASAKAPA